MRALGRKTPGARPYRIKSPTYMPVSTPAAAVRILLFASGSALESSRYDGGRIGFVLPMMLEGGVGVGVSDMSGR